MRLTIHLLLLQPFKSSTQPSQRIIVLLICFSWALSLILAFLPVSSNLAHIFIAGVDFVFNPFVTGTDVSLHSAKNVFSKMMTYYQWNSSQNNEGSVCHFAIISCIYLITLLPSFKSITLFSKYDIEFPSQI